ncbi:unnamed protein product [Effrenium voratum]|nr:unnamed protein product [Effrenium voratum]
MQELAEKNKLKSHMKVPFFCALVEMACREEGITKTVHDLAQANSGAFAMKAEVELLQVQPLEGRALRANFKAPQATKVLAKSLAFDGVQVTLAPLQRLPGSNEATCMVTWQGAREAHAGQIEEHLRKQVDELNQAKHEEKIAKNIAKQSQLLCIDLGRTRTRISSVEEDLAKRYVARLGLAAQVVAPAMHIANQALQHDFVKQGKGLLEHSLAAAAMASAIFIVAWLLDAEIKPRLADVATVVKVSEGSVQTAYRQMREQIRKLLPKGFVIQHKLGVEGLPKLEEKTRKRSADLM